MKRVIVEYEPGDIVSLAGTAFVVLDVERAAGYYPDSLFLLAMQNIGNSRFGNHNNYANSDLSTAVDEWLHDLGKKGADLSRIIERWIDLTTLDGCRDFGKLSVDAAPLTMDEARRYAGFIPDANEDYWLATGWSGPDKEDRDCALCINTKGGWDECGCSNSLGIRPALKVSAAIFDCVNGRKPDLSELTIDVLFEEISKRLKSEKENVK